MGRLFERFFGEVLSPEQPGGTWEPRLDIAASQDMLTVRAEHPGLEAKDLDAPVSGDTLTILPGYHRSLNCPE
jgi:HSP20 family molecular chaperone IbpA